MHFVLDITVLVDVNIHDVLKWRVEMHLPVELLICFNIPDKLFVQVLDTVCTGFVFFDSFIDFPNEGHKVLAILLLNLFILGSGLVEPGYDFILIKVEGEGVVLWVDPRS